MLKYVVFTFIVFTLVWSSHGQSVYENVKIFEPSRPLSYAPCEPSIAISKSDPSKMVAGAVLKYVSISSDSGKTWKTDRLKSRLGVYGDPCIISDLDGRFHYFHLSDPTGLGWGSPWILDRIVCQTSKSNGKRWSRGSSIGLNRPKQQDKEWVTYDPVSDQLIATWTQFDKYNDPSLTCHSNILMSKSKKGKKWSEPVQLNTRSGNCKDDSKTTEGATSDVDEFGNIYSAWGMDGKIVFTIAYNDRVSGTISGYSEEMVAIDSDANWAFDIPGLGRANGMPIIKCDRSGGPNNGTLYINWCDQRKGPNDTDVWLVFSKDQGRSWSEPIRVNDDAPGHHQFFTWMDLDQGTGRLHFVFYDRRNHSSNMTDVYYARSADMTNTTFENIRLSDSPFDPSAARFFGDYNNITVFNGVVRPIWTRIENGKQSIWTAIVNK